MRHRVSALALLLSLFLMIGGVVAGCGGELRSPGGVQTSAGAGTNATDGAGTGTTDGGAATNGTEVGGLPAASLQGAGATFPQPLYLEWIGTFMQGHPGVRINYQGIGSGGGIQQFTQMTVDFGASDAPMKDEEMAAAEKASNAKVLHIPTVLGAVVVAYNLSGVEGMKLDQETLAGIFLGKITRWNDPAIQAINEGIQLPDVDVQVTHRSDASGTTNIFTTYLSGISDEWRTSVGSGKDVMWPVGIGGQGNDGVAAVIKQQPGSIGYVEFSYAAETGLSVVSLRNSAGNYVEPSLESTSAAAAGISFPEDLRFSLTNSQSPGAYPIVGATWILAYDRMQDPAKAAVLKAFLIWSLDKGSDLAKELNYAPLPDELRRLAEAKVDSIR